MCVRPVHPILAGMQPSNDWLADDNDGVRASDAERDHAIGELRHGFAEGRLSQETFLYRMDAALSAKDRSELGELFTDLPDQRPQRKARRTLRDWLTRLARPGGTQMLKVHQPGQLPSPAAQLPGLDERGRDHAVGSSVTGRGIAGARRGRLTVRRVSTRHSKSSSDMQPRSRAASSKRRRMCAVANASPPARCRAPMSMP